MFLEECAGVLMTDEVSRGFERQRVDIMNLIYLCSETIQHESHEKKNMDSAFEWIYYS